MRKTYIEGHSTKCLTSTLQKCQGHETQGKVTEELSQGEETETGQLRAMWHLAWILEKERTLEEAGWREYRDTLCCLHSSSVGPKLFQTKK